PFYFKWLAGKDGFHNPRVKVHVIEVENNSLSAPHHVLERMNGYVDKNSFGEEDTFWLVIDLDRWGASKLSEIATLCTQKNYQLVISSRCFEVWILLHFESLETETKELTVDDLIDRIKNYMPYKKNIFDTGPLKDKTHVAIENAEKLDL